MTTGLIVGGQEATRDQFPWYESQSLSNIYYKFQFRLAAYYHNGRTESLFICGGSLISTKLIVTAAHCVHPKDDSSIKKAEEATFYMGKHNLELLAGEQNYIMSPVTKFIIHPEWNFLDKIYDADISIAVLSRTIEFTKFIRPICIWTATNSFSDLIGKKGVVAGWGKTEYGVVSTAKPKWAEIPIVDQITCLRSNRAFSQLTSDRTFCAGDRTGTKGPCNGDSGKF